MLEKVYALLEGIGMTPEELVLKWIENGRVDLDRIAELAKQNSQNKDSEIKKIKEVEPGMFLTSDGTVCCEYDGENSLAIILAVNRDKKTALVFNIAGSCLPFSRDGLDTDTSGFSGLNATHFISQMAFDAGITAEAADYCLLFENDFVQKGNAFLLSKEEVQALENDADKIYRAFSAAKIADKIFWTSTTFDGSSKQAETANKMAYIFGIGSPNIPVRSENARLPLDVHPAYTVNLKKLL